MGRAGRRADGARRFRDCPDRGARVSSYGSTTSALSSSQLAYYQAAYDTRYNELALAAFTRANYIQGAKDTAQVSLTSQFVNAKAAFGDAGTYQQAVAFANASYDTTTLHVTLSSADLASYQAIYAAAWTRTPALQGQTQADMSPSARSARCRPP